MSFAEFLQACTEQWTTILIASAICLVLYCWGIAPYRSLRSRYGDIPGPKYVPFLGNIVDTIRHKNQLHLQVHEYYLRYGNVFKMYFFGPTPCLVVGDPEMLKDIFVREFDSFTDRPQIVNPPEPLASMLNRAKREQWRRIRNTLTPAFSALKMKQMIPLINDCCDTTMKKLSEVVDKQKSINIVKYSQALTMDVILLSVFGFQANSQENPNDPVISIARKALIRSSSQIILLASVLPFGLKIIEKFPSIWLSKIMPLIEMAEEIVATKRARVGDSPRKGQCHRDFALFGQNSTKYLTITTFTPTQTALRAPRGKYQENKAFKDMLDIMLAAADDPSLPDSKKLSDTEVIAQSFVFLAAGYETSSATLSLACHHIATHPEVQDKLQQEIDSVWSDEEQIPTYETVNELSYLDMVISETLRLYPPGFSISRSCNRACTIKGIKIPKDSPVIIPVYSVQRDPSIYPDPEKFDPDRFSSTAKQSRSPYAFLPFGHGPHSCIGMRFALMQIKLVLARILKTYRLEVAPDTKIPPDVRIKATLACAQVNVRVASRNKQ